MTDTTGNSARPSAEAANVSIESVLAVKERTIWQQLLSSQAFWVSVVLIVITVMMGFIEPRFISGDNMFSMSRNFSFIGIMALGLMPVIITGGIDLSVGSIMGVVAIVCGLLLLKQPADLEPTGTGLAYVSNALYLGSFEWAPWLHTWWAAILAGLLTGALMGAINGWLIAYVGLPSFVVTLGMLSAVRSVAVVSSGNKMLYEFRDDAAHFKMFGAGAVNVDLGGVSFSLASPFIVMVICTVLLAVVMLMSTWGRHILAIGGNENAARLTGVPVKRVKMQAYVLSGVMAAVAAILSLGWTGSAINALGTGYELRAIASAVIGGADLMGGAGSAFGALVGSVLLEVIRNALLMAGVDSNWQGFYVGAFLILAVLLQRMRASARD